MGTDGVMKSFKGQIEQAIGNYSFLVMKLFVNVLRCSKEREWPNTERTCQVRGSFSIYLFTGRA